MYLKKETSPFHKKFIGVCQITGDLSLECVVFEIMASALLPLLSVLSWRSCTTQTIERIRSGKSTKPKQNAHKRVPALDIQSLMNTFGFNEKKQKNIYLYMRVYSNTRHLKCLTEVLPLDYQSTGRNLANLCIYSLL